tara:strand:+ start:25 stop:396 length:372 start_codon:yes stop_codon:yes gene_type:complete
MALRKSIWKLQKHVEKSSLNNFLLFPNPLNGSKYFYIEFLTMATYPVVNKESGEQKEVILSVHDWPKWCDDNPDWKRDWSDPSTCPGAGEVGEWKDKLVAKNPGWNDVLAKASKAPGSRVKKI